MVLPHAARRRILRAAAGACVAGLAVGCEAVPAVGSAGSVLTADDALTGDAARRLPDSELPAAWAAVRPLTGHFDGAPWRAEIDRWQGYKHVLMQRLAQALLARRATGADIEAAFGAPDERVPAGSARHGELLAQVSGEPQPALTREPGQGAALPTTAELWLYRWRATHDQLLLALHEGRLGATAWLLQGE